VRGSGGERSRRDDYDDPIKFCFRKSTTDVFQRQHFRYILVLPQLYTPGVLSLLDQVRHAYRPRTRVLVKDAEARWCAVPAAPDQLAAPGIVVYRFEANLFYANASFFVEEMLRLVTTAKTPMHGLVLDLTGIDDIDYTAAKMLLQVKGELNKRGIALVSVAISGDAIDHLRRYGLPGEDFDKRVYPTVDAAVAALGTNGNALTTAQ
jgi:MFS superfamily sulfate permease-like transporter